MTLALVLRYWRELTIGAAVVLLMAACHARDNALKATGIAVERARVADSTLAAVKPQLARAETLIVHDTKTVRVAVDRVVTLRDTVLEHLTDTLLVKTFVTRADSAAKACVELSNDCQAFRAFATQTIAALEAKVRVAPIATPAHRRARDLLTLSVGVGLGWVAHRR